MAHAELLKLYGAERVHEAQLAFATLDDQGSGKLTMAQFRASLGMLGVEADFTSMLFSAFDQDGDAKINFAEFFRGIQALSGNDQEEKVQFAFNLLDGEQKGHIRVDDVVALGLSISKLLRAMRATAPLSANEVHRHSARYFAELDGGADGTVSFAQFRRALQVRLRRPCLAALHSVTGGRVIFAGFVCLLSVEAAPSALYRDAGTATPTSHCPPHSHGLAAQPCGRVCPHLRRDSPTSAPGLAHVCAGTCPHRQ